MGSSLFLLCIWLVHIAIADVGEDKYTYTDESQFLSIKSLNIYKIGEISNVCYDGSTLLLFNLPSSQVDQISRTIDGTSLTWKPVQGSVFSSESVKLNVKPVSLGLLLATSSSEDFQAYRLLNSLLYLSRNGINTSLFSTVYLHTERKTTEYADTILKRYFEILSSQLNDELTLSSMEPFCVQQLIVVTSQPEVKDVIYQLDTIYIRKLIYKGKPEYPIPRRKFKVVVNQRSVVPKWKSYDSLHRYFDNLAKNCRAKYMTFGEMSASEIINTLKETDIFVTTYGDDSVFLVFMVPYSVFIEVQPDYFHDSTTSIIAYASDIYPIILRDVYSEIPANCKVENGLIQSDQEPCRSTLKQREIEFDIKSMTQAIAQSQYYLWNYKMKQIPYWFVC